MNKLCRACMKCENETEIFYKFAQDEENLLKFIDVTSIKIKYLKICKDCYQQLLNAFKFREKCLDSHQQLKSIYNIPDDKHKSINRASQYVCRYCDKVFSKNYNLKRHTKTHFKCNSLEQPTNNIDDEEMIQLDSNQDLLAIEKNTFDDTDRKNPATENLLSNIKQENSAEKSFLAIDFDKCKIEKIDVEVYSPVARATEIEKDETDENEIYEEDEINGKIDIYEIEKPNPKNKRLGMHVCNICFKKFDRKSGLARHSNVHNPEKKFECHYEYCKIRFSALNSLNRHFLVHDLTQNGKNKMQDNVFYQCPQCPRKFEKNESLSAHRKIHKQTLDEIEWECKQCNSKYNNRSALRRHELTHDENKEYKCNICNKLFGLKSRFLDHMSRHSGVKPFNCEICEKGFTQSCSLRDHMRIHTQEKPFLCNECGKSFNNGSNLRQHVDRHRGIKRFTCTECPARFLDNGSLKSHMITHTGEKKHICEICSSSFTKGHSLRKHMRIHTGEKPFECASCPMKFISANHLKRHTRTHTGEKPYKCTFCERAFSQSNDLVKHLRSHVGDKVYQCKVCPESFRLHTELRHHLQEHFQQTKEGTNQTVLNKLNIFGTINTFNGHTFLKTAADVEKPPDPQITELRELEQFVEFN